MVISWEGRELTKDIYIIKNSENNLCYIGQSTNCKQRLRQHQNAALRGERGCLWDAMREIGVGKFYCEILESNVLNFDERERYWIKQLNTIFPNGYNVATGGGGNKGNFCGIIANNSKIRDDAVLQSIYKELLHTDLSLTEIGRKYGVSYNVIGKINSGDCYRDEKFTYPLREFTLSKERLDRLTYDLKYSNLSYRELAELYHLSTIHIKAINSGRSQHRDYLDYPLRRVVFCDPDNMVAARIQKELLSTNKKYEEIAKQYGCSVATVRRIDYGEVHRDDRLQYPLQKRKLRESTVQEIHRLLLNTDMPIIKIAQKFGVSDATIKRINNGATKKYRDEYYQYPLRPLQPVSTIRA